eukprot:scaffold336_cov250-Pinguiococcus_pyrenoidosus.AAC.33
MLSSASVSGAERPRLGAALSALGTFGRAGETGRACSEGGFTTSWRILGVPYRRLPGISSRGAPPRGPVRASESPIASRTFLNLSNPAALTRTGVLNSRIALRSGCGSAKPEKRSVRRSWPQRATHLPYSHLHPRESVGHEAPSIWVEAFDRSCQRDHSLVQEILSLKIYAGKPPFVQMRLELGLHSVR